MKALELVSNFSRGESERPRPEPQASIGAHVEAAREGCKKRPEPVLRYGGALTAAGETGGGEGENK